MGDCCALALVRVVADAGASCRETKSCIIPLSGSLLLVNKIGTINTSKMEKFQDMFNTVENDFSNIVTYFYSSETLPKLLLNVILQIRCTFLADLEITG